MTEHFKIESDRELFDKVRALLNRKDFVDKWAYLEEINMAAKELENWKENFFIQAENCMKKSFEYTTNTTVKTNAELDELFAMISKKRSMLSSEKANREVNHEE